MQKTTILTKLFKSIDFKTEPKLSDFEKCFAHINQYEHLPQNNNVGNSRYVFLGQYAFKGLVAHVVFKYIGGNGKQLQHYLGNVFSNEKLSEIFDKLELDHLITYKAGFDYKGQKHIFAAAFFGFLYENATDEYCTSFINKYFILRSDNFLPKTQSINIIQILQAKAEQVIKEKIKLVYTQKGEKENSLFGCSIYTKTDTLIAQHESKSATYAKKKAIKLALNYLLTIERESPTFKAMEARLLAEESRKKSIQKKLIQVNHQQFLQEKAEKRKLAVEIKRKEAKEREYKRLLNKKNLKLGEKPSKISKEIDTANMSSKNKQRHIDKAK